MLTFLKNLFGQKDAAPVMPPLPAKPKADAPAPTPSPANTPKAPQVAVAQLSLAAIIDKFPEDLRAAVAKPPGATVTVALPLATIHKQLGNGSVKMSLASLYRQAPAGTFTQARTEDKRMVDVPLSEVFRHVDAQSLRRRGDQRRLETPRGGPGLFGDKNNPFAISPLDEMDEDPYETPAPRITAPLVVPELKPEPEPEPEPVSLPPSRGSLAPPPGMGGLPTNGHGHEAKPAPETELEGTISFPLSYLCALWPEPIRGEALGLAESNVELPAAALARGLAKGRVIFTWGQIRSWMTPPSVSTAGEEATELNIPLKAVAPLFMAHSRPAPRRHSIELDSAIPALFTGPVTEELPPFLEEPRVAEPPPVEPPSAPAASLPAPAIELPSIEPAPALEFPSLRLAPEPEPQPEPTVAPALPPSSTPALSSFETLAELFSEPGKSTWSAQEIIERTGRLPGVTGTVLALQEGLLIASHLPESIKGDTVAAFLPQIFARLNHYTGEMALAAVDEIRLTLAGLQFHAWRIGEVYFAALLQPDSTLPAEALPLVVRELTAQAPK